MGVKWEQLAFYGGSFTCLQTDLRQELYKIANNFGFNNIRISTSPDCIDENVLTEAEHNNVKIIELGIQSLSDKVLKNNGRPYSADDAIKSLYALKDRFKIGVQIMTGMYSSDNNDFYKTVEEIRKLKPEYVRIYQCMVLKNTKLAQMYLNKEFIPCSLKVHLIDSAYAYVSLVSEGINIIRIGLPQSGGNIEGLIAGNYHLSMGELVKTLVLMLYIREGCTIKIGKKFLSSVCGYKGILTDEIKAGAVITEDDRKVDFVEICKILRSKYFENSKRYFEGVISKYAEELINKTDNR